MAKTILQYLAEVEDRLCGSLDDATLRRVLAETESHLRESAEEIQGFGMQRLEAEEAAVKAFGESETYGAAVETVDSFPTNATPKAALQTAAIVTGILLLWPLLIRTYAWLHPNETLASMSWAVTPIVALAVVAFVTGSRAKVRNLYLIGLAGGVLLTPILAYRFVGSVMRGGLVVRSLKLRDAALDDPASFRQTANWDIQAIKQLDLELDWVRHGRSPYLVGERDSNSGMGTGHSPIERGKILQKTYLGPSSNTDTALTAPQVTLDEFTSEAESLAHWKANGASLRARYVDAQKWFADRAAETQRSLDEPFLVRWLSVWSYAPVVTIAWGTLLVAMQALGLILRRLATAILKLSGWTYARPAAGK